jgi:hypothetical protein
MAVAENVGTKIDSPTENLDNTVVSSDSTEVEKSKPKTDQNLNNNNNGVINHQQQQDSVPTAAMTVPNGNHGFKTHQMGQMHGNGVQNQPQFVVNNDGYVMNGNGGESFKREMRDLEELLSKLNPMAEEFVPPSLVTNYHGYLAAGPNAGFGYPNNFMIQNNFGNANGQINRRVWLFCFLLFCLISFYSYHFLYIDCDVDFVLQRKSGYNNAKRRGNNYKMDMEKREEMIRRTVYVSDIDQLVGILAVLLNFSFHLFVRFSMCVDFKDCCFMFGCIDLRIVVLCLNLGH